MTLHLILGVLVCGFFSDSQEMSCAAGPVAWGASVSSNLDAPAGLVRIEGWQCFLGGMAQGSGDGYRITGGFGWNPGIVSTGFGMGIGTGESAPDTLVAAASFARVITGNPIGFMEGLFGPNISAGGSIKIVHIDALSSKTCLLGGVGIQFSVFPSFAVGATVMNIPLSGNNPWNCEWEYGITHVFNRDIRGHLTVLDNDVSAGADLWITDAIRASTGTDGKSWRLGTGIDTGNFCIDYGLDLSYSSTVHSLTVRFSPGGRW